MRYRINLYRERAERAQETRRHLMQTAGLGVVLGLEVLLLLGILLVGQQLRSRATALRAGIQTLQAASQQIPESQDVQMARRLVDIRLNRVDWSGVLESVAATIPRDLVLYEIKGGVSNKIGALRGLDVNGYTVGAGTDLSSVFRFIEELRDTTAVSRSFPVIDLGTAQGKTEGSGQQAFQIVCRARTSGAAPEEGTP